MKTKYYLKINVIDSLNENKWFWVDQYIYELLPVEH